MRIKSKQFDSRIVREHSQDYMTIIALFVIKLQR